MEPVPARKQEIVRSAEKNVHRICNCIYYIEEDFTIVQVDDQFEKLTGYSKEEALSGLINHMSLIFEEDKKEYLEYVLPENGRGEDLYLEHRLRRKDGSSIFVYCYGHTFYDSAVGKRRARITVFDCDDPFGDRK